MKPQAKHITTQQTRTKKTKSMSLMIISAACVVVVFCLVAAKALITNALHQQRVVNAKHQAVAQLKSDISAINTLTSQYQAFNSASTNIIGGSSNGTGPNDGSNPQIVLDALPSQYDFPGLTASVEKILSQRGVKLDSISGIDNESVNIPNAVASPAPVPITFSFSATSNYAGIKRLFKDFDRSIRPFHVVTIQFTGTDSQMAVNSTINTYFQPAKSLSIKSKGIQ